MKRMKITWNDDNTVATDENGNTATTERWGTTHIAIAALESNTGCTNCIGCTNCTNCNDCVNCTDCTGCVNCADCADCANCTDCTGCAGCAGCTNCHDCTDCTDEHGKRGAGHDPAPEPTPTTNLGNEVKVTWNDDHTVATDENGNSATTERWGTTHIAIAALGSNTGCTNCIDCSECINCHDCARCTYCRGCTCCTNCTDEHGKRGEDHDPVPDPVNHPAHYTQHPSGIEVIEITEHMGFCLGNAIKYILRAEHKGNFERDLRKAIWYIEREIARRGKK